MKAGVPVLVALRGLGIALATLASILFARAVGAQGYGEYASGLAVVNMVFVLGSLGVDQLQLLHALPVAEAYRRARIVAVLTALVLAGVVSAWPGFNLEARIVGVCIGIGFSLRLAVVPWLVEPQKSLQFVRRGVREFLLNVFPPSVMAASAMLGMPLVVNALSMAVVYGGFVTWVYATARNSSVADAARATRARWSSGFPYALSAAVFAVYTGGDALIIATFSTSYDAGQYKAAYMFLTAAAALPVVLNNDILRSTVGHDIREGRDPWPSARSLLAVSLASGLALATFLVILGPSLVAAVFGEGFAYAKDLIRNLSFAIAPMFASSWAANYLAALGRIRLVLALQSAICVVNLIANLIYVPQFGAVAASAIMPLTEFIMATSLFCVLLFRFDRWAWFRRQFVR